MLAYTWARSGPVASKLVNAPAGRPDNAAHVGRRDQHRENVAQPPYQIVAKFPAVVVFDQAQQPPVLDAPNDHIRVYANTVHRSSGSVAFLLDLVFSVPGMTMRRTTC